MLYLGVANKLQDYRNIPVTASGPFLSWLKQKVPGICSGNPNLMKMFAYFQTSEASKCIQAFGCLTKTTSFAVCLFVIDTM